MTAPLDLAAIRERHREEPTRRFVGTHYGRWCRCGAEWPCDAAQLAAALEAATERERALRKAVIAWLETNHYGEQIAAERRIRAIVYPGSFAADRATGAEAET